MKSFHSLALFAVILAGASCVLAEGAKYVDTSGNKTIVTLNQINPQDWANMADQMVGSLLESGVLERAPEKPAIMAISRISNKTQMQIDTDLLIKKIRVALLKSGKVVTTTTVGIGGKSEDPLAADAAEQQKFVTGENTPDKLPFYSLSGKILEDKVKNGRVTQVTYTFQLSLTTVKDGLAVWEDEKQVMKQDKKPAVGW
jgi:uncharacterized protein (TIGR02722 family)